MACPLWAESLEGLLPFGGRRRVDPVRDDQQKLLRDVEDVACVLGDRPGAADDPMRQPGQQSLQPPVSIAQGRIHGVEVVHRDRDARPPGRGPAQDPREMAVRVHHVGLHIAENSRGPQDVTRLVTRHAQHAHRCAARLDLRRQRPAAHGAQHLDLEPSRPRVPGQ